MNTKLCLNPCFIGVFHQNLKIGTSFLGDIKRFCIVTLTYVYLNTTKGFCRESP